MLTVGPHALVLLSHVSEFSGYMWYQLFPPSEVLTCRVLVIGLMQPSEV